MSGPTQAPEPPDTHSYAFGPFQVDVASYQLRQNDAVLPLTPKAFDTLLVLLRHRDRIVGKDELMNAVWPGLFVSEDSLTQSISVLRRTLGDDPNSPKYIATIARIGYRFVAPVEDVTAVAPAVLPADDAVEQPPRATAAPPVPAVAASPRVPARTRNWLALAAAVAAALVGAAVFRQAVSQGAAPVRGPLRFTQEAPEGTVLQSGGVLAPDGRFIAFVAQEAQSGRKQLWVRSLDSATARSLAGTEGAERPFWSPDSTALGFFASGQLKRVALDGTPPRVIAPAGPVAYGGSWSQRGVVLFTTIRGSVLSVPADGGTPTPVTTIDSAAHEVAHRWPQFLPDGRRFLVYVDSADSARNGTFLASLDSSERTRIIDAPAYYAPSGHLLFIRDRVLMAQPFSPATGLTGRPTTLAGNVVAPETTNESWLSASGDGLLAFSVAKGVRQLEWFDRQGRSAGTVTATVDLRNPMLSADGQRLVAASRSHEERRGIWAIDVERGAISRLTSDGMRPWLSPSGDQIVFTSDRTAGVADIYMRPIAGRDGDETLLVQSPDNKFVSDWTADGRYLVYGSTDRRANTDLWLLPLDGSRTPRPLLTSRASEVEAQVSPDGRWLAYASDESGTWEVYVQPFPDLGSKYVVSLGGGVEPHWRRDGGELFYLGTDGRIMAVDIKPGATFAAGPPRPLFRAPVTGVNVYINQYTVAPDGQRFLVDAGQRSTPIAPITVLVNWTALVRP